MKRSIVLSSQHLTPMLAVARTAEAAGLHRVWTTESTGRDGVIRAAALAAATTSIQIGCGIAYAFTRSPLAMAAAGADIQILSGGRFTLGLGAGTRGMRKRYGIADFDQPARRLADYAQAIRTAWTSDGTGLSYDGQFYHCHAAGRLYGDEFTRLPVPAIAGSGVNTVMLARAFEFGDGVLLHPLLAFAPHLERTMGRISELSRDRSDGRAWSAAWIITSVNDVFEVSLAQARLSLAFYLTTPSYQSVTAGSKWESVSADIASTYRANLPTDLTELSELIPEEMIDDFCIAATPDTFEEKVARAEQKFAAAGVDEIVFQVAAAGLGPQEFEAACHAVISNAGRAESVDPDTQRI